MKEDDDDDDDDDDDHATRLWWLIQQDARVLNWIHGHEANDIPRPSKRNHSVTLIFWNSIKSIDDSLLPEVSYRQT